MGRDMNRPTSVTILGILNIVFAAMGLLGIAVWVAMSLMPQQLNPKNPVLELMQQNAFYAIYTKISIILGLFVAIVLGLAGIGLLMLHPWGRWLSIGYSIYAILIVFINSGVFYYCFLQPMLAKQAAMPPGPDRLAISAGIAGAVVGPCFSLVYPIVLLIFMYRPNVVAALSAPKPPDTFSP
jgi:hypothetical protein